MNDEDNFDDWLNDDKKNISSIIKDLMVLFYFNNSL